jgi:predicted membrane channel-forming protein YqfA (hemolysin III family)
VAFVNGIIGFVNKMINKLFGKTHIFVILLAWFLIITGIFMLWKPEKARKSLAGRGFGLIKGYLFIIAVFLGALLVGAANKLNGLLALAILVLGIVLLIKGYLFLKKKISNKIREWLEKVAITYLRGYAIIQIVIGIAMLALRERIFF